MHSEHPYDLSAFTFFIYTEFKFSHTCKQLAIYRLELAGSLTKFQASGMKTFTPDLR